MSDDEGAVVKLAPPLGVSDDEALLLGNLQRHFNHSKFKSKLQLQAIQTILKRESCVFLVLDISLFLLSNIWSH